MLIEDSVQIQGMTVDQRGAYLEEAFDLAAGGDYTRYFTDIEAEPLEFIERGAALEKGQLRTTFGKGQQEATAGKNIALSQSGLATSGTIQGQFQQQMQGLTQDYQAGMKKTQLGLEKDLYGEKKRQQERWYEEIGAMPF